MATYVLINGAFGIGKTTAAARLAELLPGSRVLDPERVGLALRVLPWNRGSDFQDLRAWRRMTTLTARAVGRLGGPVIMPMAISEPLYLEEIRSALAASGGTVLHFCLTAPIEVVRRRLAERGEPYGAPRWSWVHRRAAECCLAHAGSDFEVQLSTDGVSPDALAEHLAQCVRDGCA